MVVVERFTGDGFLCVLHPYLADVLQFEQTKVYDVLLGTVGAKVAEVHLPRGVLYFALLVGSEAYAVYPVVVIIAAHVVVTMIAVDGH